jgi:bifunctional DNA-binding transcriptional regulator/antitoxin component of YhaV-PrlF toxin-antitoxin module
MTHHTTVSSKALVIPVEFRRRLGIKKGTSVALTEKDGALNRRADGIRLPQAAWVAEGLARGNGTPHGRATQGS